MTLRRKVLFIIGATFVALIAALYLVSRAILLDSFLALEHSRGEWEIARAVGFISQELAQMDRLANDYASWDDTYAYVIAPDRHREYVHSNLVDSTFQNQKLNMLLLADTEGRIVFGRAFDLRKNREVPVPQEIVPYLREGASLFLGRDEGASSSGVILMPAAPLLVAARPILTSDNKGPARGTLVMGRYFDAAHQAPHGMSINAPMEVRRADDPDLPADFRDAARRLTIRAPIFTEPISADHLAAYAVYYSLSGKPALYLKLLLQRDIYSEGKKAIHWSIFSLVVVGLVVGAAIAVLLQRQVLSRLTHLSRALAAVGARSGISGRVPVSGNDELADLARDINGMLEALEKSQRELSESEVRYRSIVENTRDVIILTRPDGTISYISPACRDVLGYTQEDLTDCRPSLVHPDDKAREQQAYAQALGGESGTDVEYRVVTKRGAVRWVSHSWSPILFGERITMIVSVIRDITERRRMEEELIRAQKLETVGVLAGGIAHDFNNILTSIWGNLSLARAAAPNEEVNRLLAEAEKASARARDLTQQLLTFSKGGAPVRRVLSLGSLLGEAAGFALSGSNSRCEMEIPASLWPVEADEGQLHQVVNNLVLNAVQAMPQGGVIRISARNVRAGTAKGIALADRDYVMFSVSDKGVGIPEAHLQRIFDPYFTTKQRGSGLGLSIGYSIVKKHNGMITVRSTLGKGSTFRVYLPAAARDAVCETLGMREPPRGTGRILLMDDDEDVRTVAGRMMEHLGYEVVHSIDGSEMLARYAEAREAGKPFDAVVMDLTVSGGMGGKEAVARLLALDPTARAVASSGYSNDPVAADYAKFGFKAFVPKPYRIEQLAVELQRVLGRVGAA